MASMHGVNTAAVAQVLWLKSSHQTPVVAADGVNGVNSNSKGQQCKGSTAPAVQGVYSTSTCRVGLRVKRVERMSREAINRIKEAQ
eukprot:1147761-Pelagomonas_calceolata.AAC.2